MKYIGTDIDRAHRLRRYQLVLPYRFATILDIGANIGQFSQEMLDIFPDAQLYAFEPISGCFARLKKISKRANFHPFPYALGNKNGDAEIHVSPYSQSSSILPISELQKTLLPYTAGGHKETIQMRRLDDIATGIDLKPPVLIKMDVEGYEKEILLGGQETFKKTSVVFSETSFVPLHEGQPLADEIRSLLGTLGFEYRGFLGQKKNPRTGEALLEDSIFIKRVNI